MDDNKSWRDDVLWQSAHCQFEIHIYAYLGSKTFV